MFCHGAPFWNSVCTALKAKDSDSDEDNEDNTASVNESNSAGHAPLTTLLCSLRPNVVVVVRIPEYHVGWCEAVEMVLPGGGVLGDVATPSAPMMGEWLFALLARLEKPLHPDVESLLRSEDTGSGGGQAEAGVGQGGGDR